MKYLLAAFYLSSALTAHAGMGVYFDVENHTYSETVPLESAIEDWYGPDFERGDNQWSWTWAESGIYWRQWQLGYLMRQDYDLRFSKDLAELYWKSENNIPLDIGRQYDVNLEANSFRAKGLRLSFGERYSNFRYRVGMSYLEAEKLISGALKGNATATGGDDYELRAVVDYHYYEDYLFDRPVAEPNGKGLTLDVEMSWDQDRHHALVQVRDLYGRIRWQDAPFTEGIANSDNTDFDAEGYRVANPSFAGREGYDTFTQTLTPRWYMEYDYAVYSIARLGLVARYQYDQFLHGYRVGLGKKYAISVDYWPEPQQLQVNARLSTFELSVGANSSNAEVIDTVWLAISAHIGTQP